MWKSNYDVLRDLSVAQGCSVPKYIPKSSKRNVTPESSDYDIYAAGDNININAPPDLFLINQMLAVCRKDEDLYDENEEVLQNSDLSPWSDTFVPRNETDKSESTALSQMSSKMRKKLERNVALTSILNRNNEDLRQELNNGTNRKKKGVYIPRNADMFRKKIKSPQCQAISQNTSNESPQSQDSTYEASPLAAEYYQKYLDRVEKKKKEEEMRQDMWMKVTKKMDKKSRVAARVALQANQSTAETGCDPMDKVRLAQHRHLMSEDCVVCQVLCENYKKTENVISETDEANTEQVQ